MNDISRYVPITKAKNELLDLIRQIESVGRSVAVTKNGVPAAVIISMEKSPVCSRRSRFLAMRIPPSP